MWLDIRWTHTSVILTFTFLLPSLTATSRVKVSYITVQMDGIINSFSQLPTCGDEERINLLSYEYLHRICRPGSICISNRTGHLSSLAGILIHESCSLQQACKNISIPIGDLQTHIYNTISILYECIDRNSFLDLCSNTEININSTFHLVSNENAMFKKGCECRVDGLFSLKLSDVRLTAKNTEVCSPAIVSVQYLTSSRKFSCNNHSESYGYVFQHVIETLMPRATIAFETRSRTVAPEMVWLTLAPKTSLKLECSYIPRIDATAKSFTDTVPTSFSVPSRYSGDLGIVKITTNGVAETQNPLADIGILVGPAVAGSCVVIIIVIGIVVYICRKKTSQQRQSEHQAGRDTPVLPNEQNEPFLLKSTVSSQDS